MNDTCVVPTCKSKQTLHFRWGVIIICEPIFYIIKKYMQTSFDASSDHGKPSGGTEIKISLHSVRHEGV